VITVTDEQVAVEDIVVTQRLWQLIERRVQLLPLSPDPDEVVDEVGSEDLAGNRMAGGIGKDFNERLGLFGPAAQPVIAEPRVGRDWSPVQILAVEHADVSRDLTKVIVRPWPMPRRTKVLHGDPGQLFVGLCEKLAGSQAARRDQGTG
jgi:hypothetical protein